MCRQLCEIVSHISLDGKTLTELRQPLLFLGAVFPQDYHTSPTAPIYHAGTNFPKGKPTDLAGRAAHKIDKFVSQTGP